jgi:catecholate siderophore receptor
MMIPSRLIRDQRMQNLGDVVRYVPGMTMGQGEGNRDQITIRGNSSTADFFVDGVRDDVQYFRDLYNLERVEAVKGPNAMIFGRGAGGGLVNRVTKQPEWATAHDVSAEAGSFGARRITTDLQRSISPWVAARLNSVYENSDTYRNGVSLERSGINPTLAIGTPSRATTLSLGYEYFEDRRTADRGIPSLDGKPLRTSPSTFFGNPSASPVTARVNSANATLSHDAGSAQVRSTVRFADYDKFYQNIFPGAVTPDGSNVSISGYSNSTDRRNIFSQTDVTLSGSTGAIGHHVLIGAEMGRQSSDNFRKTAYFDGTATSVMVPVQDPIAGNALTFKQSASDADNGTVVLTRSLYFQDEISITQRLRFVAGARYERFEVSFEDLRSGAKRSRTDGMLSPRAGLVAKPSELVAFYASYSMSSLPGSGDQFASLTEVSEALRPERFTNYEAGVKWDVLDRLALTAAAYRLDRTNTRAVNPADPTRLLQTGAQRSQGIELGAAGAVTRNWEIAGGFARQEVEIVRATAASEAGARVPFVPRTTFSLWNRYDISAKVGLAVGAIHQSSMFAAIDNKVTLPAFERFDAALYARIAWGLSAQVNVENILDRRYYPTAHSNNNITPGSPRSFRVSLTSEF